MTSDPSCCAFVDDVVALFVMLRFCYGRVESCHGNVVAVVVL